MSNWFKKQLKRLALATGNVEEDMLKNYGKESHNNTATHQKHQAQSLMQALINGEVTEEVEQFRWRMYKVIEESEKYKTNFKLDKAKLNTEDGESERNDYKFEIGNFEHTTTKIDPTKHDIEGDPYSPYKVDMAYINNNQYTGLLETKSVDFDLSKSLEVKRSFPTSTKIEDHVEFLHVRTIDNEEKLLDLYITKYKDEFSSKTSGLVNKLMLIKDNKKFNDPIFDMEEISFVTNKTAGSRDFRKFSYKVKNVDKIVEHEGHLIVKLITNVVVDGEYIMEEYRKESLDEAYEKKKPKENATYLYSETNSLYGKKHE